jgi:NAD(P)-dependent dehydrogenase (short-subunit alcohol dehydrogenase family)
MAAAGALQFLRDGVLAEVSIALVGAPGSGPATASVLAGRCAQLGASVSACELRVGREGLDDAAAAEQLERTLRGGEIDVLIVDAAALFAFAAAEPSDAAAAGPAADGVRTAPLSACLEACWSATHAVVNGCFLPRGRGGRIIYLAPAPAGAEIAGAERAGAEHGDAARAGLENLARTLSIEWARHGITAVAVAPGRATSAEELAELSAYLASPAGRYFSGCLLDLRGPRR